MIFDGILLFIVGTINNVLSFLPVVQIPALFIDSVFSTLSYLFIFDFLIPINTITTVIALVFLFELAMFAWAGFNWLLRKLPFIN